MMRCLACVLSLGFFALVPEVTAQVVTEMTPDRIAEAIAASQNDKVLSFYPLQIGSWWDGHSSAVGKFTTPFSRVVQAAREARRKYRPFTIADVTPEMIAPEVYVYGGSFVEGTGAKQRVVDVEAVVILPVGRMGPASAIHPLRTTDATAIYQNLMGATWTGKGVVVAFPLTVLSEANELHIIYSKAFSTAYKGPSDDWAVPFKLKGIR